MVEKELQDILAERPNAERYRQCMKSSVLDKAEKIFPHLEELHANSHNPRFLSIGCGPGALEQEMAHHFPNATILAVDLSLPMLESIPGNPEREMIHPHREIWKVQADARALPIDTGSMDAIIASSVVHEIASFTGHYRFGPTIDYFFRKAGALLMPGGRLIVRDFMQPEAYFSLTSSSKL